MIKAVIFDLDDTLTSEKEYILSGYRYIADELSRRIGVNKKIIFDRLIDLFKDSPDYVFNRLLNELQIPYTESDIKCMVEAYRNHNPKIKFYDDVLPCIEKLRENRIKTGIISDGYVVSQRKKIKALDAEKYFDHIIITSDIGRKYWKPHPKPFEIMHEMLKVRFDEMLYVGDNPEKDFYISTIYPIRTIRIYRNGIYHYADYLDDIKEHYTIDNLSEIFDVL